jgi:hypothetical protein
MLALSPDPHLARPRPRAHARSRPRPSSSPSSSFLLRILGQVHPPTILPNRLDPKSRTTTSTSTITIKTGTCPEGITGLSPGFQPWESHPNGCALKGFETERTNKPGWDGASPYRLDSSLFHPQSRERTTWASLFNRARYRYRARPVPSSSSPSSSVTDRRRGSRASYGPKGQDSLAPGLPWVSEKSVLSPEGAVDVMWRVNARSPGSDGPSPYHLPSSLFHPQSRTRTLAVSVAGPKNKSTTNKTKNYEPFTRNPNLCRRGYPQK